MFLNFEKLARLNSLIRLYNVAVLIILPIIFCCAFLGGRVALAGSEIETLQNIDIVLSSDKHQYLEISNNIKRYTNKNNFSFRVLNINDFEKDNSTHVLIIAVGMRASAILASLKPLTPIMSVYVPQYAYQNLLKKYPGFTQKYFVGAVFIDQPLQRQLRLTRLLVPDATKMGMILGAVSSLTVLNQKELINRETIYVSKLKILDGAINLQSLQKFMYDSDVILTLPDPMVHQPINAKRILYNAYRAKKPIIAFSKSYVNAGALASIYSTPGQIGKQTAEKITTYLLSENTHREKFETAEYFEIALNSNVAWSLDIRLPELEQLRDKLIKMEQEDE